MSSTPKNQSAGVNARQSESRGSVLIFVVGVLLLLAIVATAFLGTSRADRTATQQNAFNTQIDLLVDGVINIAKAKISSDESVPGHPSFEPFDAYTTEKQFTITPGRSTDDNWLASRTPVTQDPSVAFNGNVTNLAGTNLALWPVISAAVVGDRFESPWVPSAPYAGSGEYQLRENMKPTYLNFGGQKWPAFRIDDTSITPVPGNTNAPTRAQSFLAADADGDGVADSGLFRLPIGQLAGVTYYGAVRIIDNSSAINLNTAMSRDYQFTGNGNGQANLAGAPLLLWQGQFPSSIGLVEMLRSAPTAAPSAPQFDNMYSGVNEFRLLNNYRLGLVSTNPSPRVMGVENATGTTSPKPMDVAGFPRDDFFYKSMGEGLSAALAARMSNPGYAAGTSTQAKSAFKDSLALASRFAIGSADDASNPLLGTLTASVQSDPGGTARLLPYNGSATGSGIDGWFLRNFNYASETLSPPTPTTYGNRRTILTGYNAVSNLDPDVVLPPDYFYLRGPLYDRVTLGNTVPTNAIVYQQHTSDRTLVPATWGNPAGPPPVLPPMSIPGGVSTNTSVAQSKVSINQGRFEELFYGFFKTMAQPGFSGIADGAGTPFTTLFNLATTARIGVDSTIPTVHTGPGNYYRDPYIGMRFNAAAAGAAISVNRNEPGTPPSLPSVINGQSDVPEQHPLRQFRSVLRAPHDRQRAVEPYWSINTPYLAADQVLILRAAIAAANAEALRDSSARSIGGAAPVPDNHNDRITPHEIPLIAHVPQNPAGPDLDTTPANTVNVVAHVFGLRRQPYITEVFVNTDDETEAPVAVANAIRNTQGYIAIKISNPHPIPIDIRNCRLVGLRRYREQTAAGLPTPLFGPPPVAPTLYPQMQVLASTVPTPAAPVPVPSVNDQVDLSLLEANDGVVGGLITTIPANGSLVIENYRASALPRTAGDALVDAQHRAAPAAVPGIFPQLGLATPPAGTRVAYLPYLNTVVYDRELVLMRPLNATPPDSAATPPVPLIYTYENGVAPTIDRFAPLDSYDFTGLNYPASVGSGPPRVRSQIWHYVRTSAPWQAVYPGRYDANQSITAIGDPRPRQQGTEEAYSNVDGLPGRTPGSGDVFTNLTIAPTFHAANPMVTFYPDSNFRVQLNATGWPGNEPIRDVTGTVPPNVFPYGGFRRLGDLLQVPFIGSYTIQTESFAAAGGTSPTFLEINAVTMDAALAEDTDTDDNPLPGDNGSQSREQLGRFCPLRPSYKATAAGPSGLPVNEAQDASNPPLHWVFYDAPFRNDPRRYQDDMDDLSFQSAFGVAIAVVPPTTNDQVWTNRYRWASALFNHFTFASPQDDHFANYPSQPKWQPGVTYSIGDTVQFGRDIFVCQAIQPFQNADPPPANILNPSPAALSTPTWVHLQRTPVKNGSAVKPGDRSDIDDIAVGTPATSFDYAPFNPVTVPNNDVTEVAEPVQGLININTAPEKVLAMIPWLPPGDSYTFTYTVVGANLVVTPTLAANNVPDNEDIARAIVRYRDGNLSATPSAPAHEPFATIYDLYKVPAIRSIQNLLLATVAPAEPTLLEGDFSPPNPPAAGPFDGVRFDFEEQFLMLNRVSNLITTRSDTFTVYVLVQGWRNVGTNKPELVTQRRAAVLLDRSRMIYKGTEPMKQLSKLQTQ